MATDCRCGSGGHPRRCAIHPDAYDRHVRAMSIEPEDWRPPRTDSIADARRAAMLDTLCNDWQSSGRTLYVGASPRRPPGLLSYLDPTALDVVEIFRPYADVLRREQRIPGAVIIHGDIAHVPLPAIYDTAVWWHGPEHAAVHTARAIVERLRSLSRRVILGTPHGPFPQRAVDDNPYQEHRSVWWAPDMEALGARVAWEGTGRGSSLVGVID